MPLLRLPAALLSIVPLLAIACAHAPPPAPPPAEEPEHPSGVVVAKWDPNAESTVEVAVAHTTRASERAMRPPPRHQHQRIITQREFDRLAAKYPLGMKPDDCKDLCRADSTVEPDGDWTWVLRCKLEHGIRGEAAVGCREDALNDDETARVLSR